MNASPMRRAALTLHALSPSDRAWIVGRLEPQQQRLVQEQLQELEQLGIAADQRLVDDALADDQPRCLARARRDALAAHGADAVRSCLQDEPAALVARMLDQGPWPWEADLLAGLDAQQRVHIAACRGRTADSSNELDEWVLSRLVERVCAIEPVAPAPSASRRPSRLGDWVARIRRSAR